MARTPNREIQEEDLHGFKHFKLLQPLLDKLHDHACARDRAHHRKLHYDQYAALILLYFFNPIVTSLRAIQQVSKLQKVQRLLGCARAALGSLSEAARIFDADLLLGIIGDLADSLKPLHAGPAFNDIKGVLTLVDGTLLPALPRLVEAMWLNDQNRAFKLHTHFELLKSVPVRMDLTDANASEREVLEAHLQPGRVYVLDRGYAKFVLFRKIVELGSSFICRIRDNSVFEVVQERGLSAEAQAAGIVHDAVVQFTSPHFAKSGLDRPLRVVQVRCQPHRKVTGHTSRGGPEQGKVLLIATDILDAPAEVIALIYKHRWAIETFFRFFKYVLGCRHLLSHCTNGIKIQTYLAIIAGKCCRPFRLVDPDGRASDLVEIELSLVCMVWIQLDECIHEFGTVHGAGHYRSWIGAKRPDLLGRDRRMFSAKLFECIQSFLFSKVDHLTITLLNSCESRMVRMAGPTYL